MTCIVLCAQRYGAVYAHVPPNVHPACLTQPKSQTTLARTFIFPYSSNAGAPCCRGQDAP